MYLRCLRHRLHHVRLRVCLLGLTVTITRRGSPMTRFTTRKQYRTSCLDGGLISFSRYSATRGLLYSHVGWIFFKPTYERLDLIERNDLLCDPGTIFLTRALAPFDTHYSCQSSTQVLWSVMPTSIPPNRYLPQYRSSFRHSFWISSAAGSRIAVGGSIWCIYLGWASLQTCKYVHLIYVLELASPRVVGSMALYISCQFVGDMLLVLNQLNDNRTQNGSLEWPSTLFGRGYV